MHKKFPMWEWVKPAIPLRGKEEHVQSVFHLELCSFGTSVLASMGVWFEE